MNVIQRPRAREFCATMQDYIVETSIPLEFSIQLNGAVILEEMYYPDNDYKIYIRDIGGLCRFFLNGENAQDNGHVIQSKFSGTFVFFFNGIEDSQSFVMFSGVHTKKSASSPGCLSEVSDKVTRYGAKEYVSGYLIQDAENLKSYGCKIIGYWEDGTEQELFLEALKTTGGISVPATFDVSPDFVASRFSKEGLLRYSVVMDGASMQFLIDKTGYADMWCFRFKNVYDMPETLTITGELKLAGGNESDAAVMYGVQRKFGVKVTDEYTANSGIIMLQSDYKLWHNLLNAQEVEILADGEWLPIVITKQKFERSFRRSVLKAVEFNFTMADPKQLITNH